MSRLLHQPFTGRFCKIALVGLLVLLRVVCLSSDAYSRLSWSSALLTDEGFYIHNARNVVLFHTFRTDDFNNALIMPLLHALQVVVFKLWGVGALQARGISVVLSLLTLGVFFAALRRAYGERVAWIGLVVLGLDPVFVLYNRMALMDTPACLPLCAAFYCWVRAGQNRGGRGEETPQHRPLLWLGLCGACLGLAYCIRGLAAILVPIPVLLIAHDRYIKYRLMRPTANHAADENAVGKSVSSLESAATEVVSHQQTPVPTAQGHVSPPLPRFPSSLSFLMGLASILIPYLLLWYVPHHQELARVNAYYLHHQLLPDTPSHLWQNVQHAFFGDDRGVAPYLFRHTPVTFTLCLLWLVAEQQITFLAAWLLMNWLLLAVISYAPDRYYVLFYPAMCGLAALALNDLRALVMRLWQSRLKRALLGGFLAYHLGEAFLHHNSPLTDVCLYAFTGLSLLTLALLPSNMSQWREQQTVKNGWIPTALFALWALIALGWTSDWLRHLSYSQRDADQWLAAHLPADSVLIGDAAPGLCMNNRFCIVNVIPGLCNDQAPVERFALAPRYIIILDDKFKEPWWRKNYPALVAPDHLVHKFPRLVRLPVGVYAVSRP